MAEFRYFATCGTEQVELQRVYHDGHVSNVPMPLDHLRRLARIAQDAGFLARVDSARMCVHVGRESANVELRRRLSVQWTRVDTVSELRAFMARHSAH